MSETKPAVSLVVNLAPWKDDLYLPSAYLARVDAKGQLTYVEKRASRETLQSFGLEPPAPVLHLLKLIDSLQPGELSKSYAGKSRKPVTLETLWPNEEIQKAILRRVHRKLDELFRGMQQTGLPLAWQLERKSLVQQHLIHIASEPLQPFLWFKRNELGVRYQLQIRTPKGLQTLHTWKEVLPLCNHPAWIFADYQLFSVEHINGNMVKPFLKQPEISIPARSVTVYFQKFILRVAQRADIEAEGFAIERHTSLKACVLEPVLHPFNGAWVLSVWMDYGAGRFSWAEPKERRSSLDVSGGEIQLIQIQRELPAENTWTDKLRQLGLQPGNGNYFCLPDSDQTNTLQWIAQQRENLEQEGFRIVGPMLGEQKLYLHPSEIKLESLAQNDWFDLKGTVQVGAFRFPFADLVPFIRNQNRYYPLPNGELFLIPETWMERYFTLAKTVQKGEQGLRVLKSQFPLLQELDLLKESDLASSANQQTFRISPELRATLRPYQLEGVRWMAQLYEQGLGACLADDMGLGKTLQTIALLLHARDQKPASAAPDTSGAQLNLFQPASDASFLRALQALIVLPASLVFNWLQEIERFAPNLHVYVHTGSKRHTDVRLLQRFDVVLTTYQTALRDVELLRKIDFEYIVLDESQQIKNKDSKVFQAINTLQAKHRLSLSGTPIENSLSDLWAQMQFINPGLLSGFRFFQKHFITPIEKHRDEARKAELRNLVQPYLLRRTKEQVAPELPELSEQLFYCEMSPEQKKLYEKEKSAARNQLIGAYDAKDPRYKFQVLQSLTRLRQLANHPVLANPDFQGGSGKFNDVLEKWSEIQKAGHKVLIFSAFVQYLQQFRNVLETQKIPFAWLTGELKSAQRKREVERFMQDEAIQSFLISIKAGGTGLNLTAADYVFILDPWWNPFIEQQAIARAHRIGQDKNVMVIKFITRDTIEDKILQLQQRKEQVAADILGESDQLNFSKTDLDFLLA